MPEFIMPLGSAENAAAFKKLEDFTQGYVEAMFFTSTGSADDKGLEDACFGDLNPATLATIVRSCETFRAKAHHSLACAYLHSDLLDLDMA